jgi:branched-chain amino acid transport system ATP-binding protein
MSLLKVDGLVKRYGGLTATDHFNVAVAPGEIHAIIGPNGAGKSTLIGQLSGELQPNEGRILFDGRDITQLSIGKRARLGLARSYQITSVLPGFSALENVMLAVNALAGSGFGCWQPMAAVHSIVAPAQALLEQVGLGERGHVAVADMAHGEHRQLELAMALASHPKLLLLDEPMAGMSQSESGQMTRQLRALKGNHAILLVEHDMQAVFALADRITVLVYGRAIACGTPAEIRADAAVRTAYLGDDETVLDTQEEQA